MRHGDKVNNLGRTASHRRALLANMAISLALHKRITTTLAKAKALRRYFEPLVTKAKDNTTHSRRVVFSYLQSKEAVTELFGPIAEKVGERPGGYVRVIKLGFRRTDGADMAMIELVDFNEVYSANTNDNAGKKKTRRSNRRSNASAKTAVAAPVAAAVAEEAAPEVAEVENVVAEAVETAAPVVEATAPEAETPAADEQTAA